jgi:hypothetical protein
MINHDETCKGRLARSPGEAMKSVALVRAEEKEGDLSTRTGDIGTDRIAEATWGSLRD